MEKIKIQKPMRRKYGPLVLWFEDVAEIVAILQTKCENVEIKTEDYQFNTLEELKKHAGLQPQFVLRIGGSRPYAYVDLSRWNADFYVSAGDHAAHVGDRCNFGRLYHIRKRCGEGAFLPVIGNGYFQSAEPVALTLDPSSAGTSP